WGLHDGGALFDSLPKADRSPAVGDLGRSLWLRVERQTARRLPVTGAVIFTIRTLHGSLEILRGDAEAATLLVGTLVELPSALVDYKIGGAAQRDRILRWLWEDASGG